jgi:Cof subfamily protein (haloacid dehalogenase superfamily)
MLLAFDLDNTVVTRDHRLPDEIVAATEAARAAGHLVTVLTGRPHASALGFVERLGVAPGPYSVNHGALVFGPDGAVIKRRRMSGDHVRTILSPPHLPDGVPFACIVDDALYVNDPEDTRWEWAHTANRRVERFEHARIREADKVVFSSNGESERILAGLAGRVPLTHYLWGDGYLELTAEDADKGAALALIARTLGVPREETVAFGDGTNDVTMLAWAGRGVAVGPDAVPEVLAVADEHVDAPEELGVVGWLDRLLG